jgi:tetratricopeptide (TPR) repeat protein
VADYAPKLLIFRGEALHDERELTGQTVRIGRAPQNDVVLEDPGKGVSRNHAEIRFDGGRYSLVDLQSQNGIWVAGTRVPSVVLDPDVVATVGPFRLMVKAPVPVAPVAPIAGEDTGTERTQLSARQAQPLVLDDLVPPPGESSPPPPARVPDVPRADGEPRHADRRIWVGAAAVVVLLALSAVAAYKLTRKPDRPRWDSSIAQALVASGRCPEALEKQINPALTADPDNAEAKALRDKCAAAAPPPPPEPPEPTTSVPPPPSVAERLDDTEKLIAANDCPKAVEMITAVLAEDPDNERAKDVSSKANACGKPVVPPPPAVEKVVQVSPAQGGLDRLQNETEKAYRGRMAEMRKKYDDAVSVLESQRYQQAARLLDDIASQVPSGYLDLAQRRDEARSGMRADAKNRFEAAQAADKNDDYDAAINGYRRAHELDPAIQVDALIQRTNERKLTVGRKRCDEGKVEFSFGNNTTAIPAFQDAVKFLPPSDPCYAIARQRLQQLGK